MALGARLATHRAAAGLARVRTRAGFLGTGFSWRLGVGLSLGPGVGAALAAGSRAVYEQKKKPIKVLLHANNHFSHRYLHVLYYTVSDFVHHQLYFNQQYKNKPKIKLTGSET